MKRASAEADLKRQFADQMERRALKKQLATQRARYEKRIRAIEKQLEELKKLLRETK